MKINSRGFSILGILVVAGSGLALGTHAIKLAQVNLKNADLLKTIEDEDNLVEIASNELKKTNSCNDTLKNFLIQPETKTFSTFGPLKPGDILGNLRISEIALYKYKSGDVVSITPDTPPNNHKAELNRLFTIKYEKPSLGEVDTTQVVTCSLKVKCFNESCNTPNTMDKCELINCYKPREDFLCDEGEVLIGITEDRQIICKPVKCPTGYQFTGVKTFTENGIIRPLPVCLKIPTQIKDKILRTVTEPEPKLVSTKNIYEIKMEFSQLPNSCEDGKVLKGYDDQGVPDCDCPLTKPHNYNGQCNPCLENLVLSAGHCCPEDNPHRYAEACHQCPEDEPHYYTAPGETEPACHPCQQNLVLSAGHCCPEDNPHRYAKPGQAIACHQCPEDEPYYYTADGETEPACHKCKSNQNYDKYTEKCCNRGLSPNFDFDPDNNWRRNLPHTPIDGCCMNQSSLQAHVNIDRQGYCCSMLTPFYYKKDGEDSKRCHECAKGQRKIRRLVGISMREVCGNCSPERPHYYFGYCNRCPQGQTYSLQNRTCGCPQNRPHWYRNRCHRLPNCPSDRPHIYAKPGQAIACHPCPEDRPHRVYWWPTGSCEQCRYYWRRHKWSDGTCNECPEYKKYRYAINGFTRCRRCRQGEVESNSHCCQPSTPHWYNGTCHSVRQCPSSRPHRYNGDCHLCPEDRPHRYAKPGQDTACHQCPLGTPYRYSGACHQCPESRPHRYNGRCNQCPEDRPRRYNGRCNQCPSWMVWREDSRECTHPCSSEKIWFQGRCRPRCRNTLKSYVSFVQYTYSSCSCWDYRANQCRTYQPVKFAEMIGCSELINSNYPSACRR